MQLYKDIVQLSRIYRELDGTIYIEYYGFKTEKWMKLLCSSEANAKERQAAVDSALLNDAALRYHAGCAMAKKVNKLRGPKAGAALEMLYISARALLTGTNEDGLPRREECAPYHPENILQQAMAIRGSLSFLDGAAFATHTYGITQMHDVLDRLCAAAEQRYETIFKAAA